MKIIEFIRLILKHKILLMVVPLVLASIVIVLTMKPTYEYSSKTVLYTGLASGSSIEMDKKFNYFASNTAFDNLINLINSRETQEEVAIRLLAQHLMLPEADPKYISAAHFKELKSKIPEDIYDYVVTTNSGKPSPKNDSENDEVSLFPEGINKDDYEKTVENLKLLMVSSNTNFVYELLNFEDPHYSLKVVSSVKVFRIGKSDLLELTYSANDPGICQQTLAIYNSVCIKGYKRIKENGSDAVVKYFEDQLAKASEKLKIAENKLLEFNKSYNIINYYEQSKAVAIVKEEMEVDYNNRKAKLAGIAAATKKLEKKLEIQEAIQLKNNDVVDKKKQLGDLNFKIALAQADLDPENVEQQENVENLKKQAENLSKEIKLNLDELYSYQNTIEGLPVSKALPDWVDNVVETENLKAELQVMDKRNKDFKEQYSIYAPAGATIKRLEREINVSEQGYLEILHGLNLAKLKMQDSELSSNLKTIDPPYYPLSPTPTSRKVLIIAAAFIGIIFTLGILLVMEYFDDTLKNIKKAGKILELPGLGMVPKVLLNSGIRNNAFVNNRVIEIITQNILQFISLQDSEKQPKTILCFSTQKMEGKSVVAGNIAKTLKSSGKRVLVLNYKSEKAKVTSQRKYSIINRILGYKDPRIDFENPLLAKASTYLDESEYFKYTIDNHFYKAKTYEDIIKGNNIELDYDPDYVIIELPAIIFTNYPADLFNNSDLDILVCRSNRLWSESDKTALAGLQPLSGDKMNFILNGVELKEVESMLGDLPKKRTKFRKKLKSAFRFQFFNKNQI
ncbi:GumC family protein [Seonamhaeicola marinus]|uniref:Polysaccharide chain length determinant N-terminal domain-containing protein n=1 Tax=Seonamhaeicola marinus TaxID=1912246 RepID=A0A5D0I4A4_9FLAO|nr:hypothetical protein [Seonamhaeicola marinus]TYA78484.1 hypothetical protein FUA24_08995 [Seonamhaeicola marinus]